jgi:hypothetical protein
MCGKNLFETVNFKYHRPGWKDDIKVGLVNKFRSEVAWTESTTYKTQELKIKMSYGRRISATNTVLRKV